MYILSGSDVEWNDAVLQKVEQTWEYLVGLYTQVWEVQPQRIIYIPISTVFFESVYYDNNSPRGSCFLHFFYAQGWNLT